MQIYGFSHLQLQKKCHASEGRIQDVFILYMAMCMLVMCSDDDQSS